MASAIRSPVVSILNAVKAQVVAGLAAYGVTADQVRIVAEQDPPHTQADVEVLLHPSRLTPDTAHLLRIDSRVNRALLIFLRTRLALDETGSDAVWLTDPVRSHLLMEEYLIDALQDFLPADSSGNILVTDPLHLQPVSEPVKEAKGRGWGRSVLQFSLQYSLNLDVSVA